MSASNTIIQTSAPAAKSAPYPFTRQIYWCVRRELWENRSVIIVPFVAAGLMIFAVLLPVIILVVKPIVGGPKVGVGVTGTGGDAFATLWIPYMASAAPVLAASLIVAISYSLGALQGERKERSILFWKSLPISDLTTVLSKASIPLLVIPLISFVAAMVTQLTIFAIMLMIVPLLGIRHLVWNGLQVDDYKTVSMIWAGTPIGYLSFGMLYGVVVTALWYAPIYAWSLLVGGWAKRMTFVWAVAPVAALILVEKIAFGTDRLGTMLLQHLYGSLLTAFSNVTSGNLPELSPVRYLIDPELWIGLVIATLFLGAAVLLRRNRQPI